MLGAKREKGDKVKYTENFIKMIIPSITVSARHLSVPKEIYRLYREACLVRVNSPAASAALARTCLDRMLRDYWKGKINSGQRGNPNKDPTELKKLLDDGKSKISDIRKELLKCGFISTEENEQIMSFLKVGNSAAHWQKNSPNLFWDKDSPHKVGLLTSTVESLFEEWYVRDHGKKERTRELKKLSVESKSPKTSAGKTGNG